MISEAVKNALLNYTKEENLYPGQVMSQCTTFRIGGSVKCLIDVENVEQLKGIINYLKKVEIPYFVMGNGSNLLVNDAGYKGIVLRIANKMNEIQVFGNQLKVQAGALMSQVANIALKEGLTGFEFAAGIPGTIGGGVVMNAGAYGGELKHVVKSVTVLNGYGEILVLDNSTMEFGYRSSAIKNQDFLVVDVLLELEEGNVEAIKAKMDDLATRRREKQPLEFPSAGSTFKRPEGHFAGQLIMEAGLKGYSVGGAKVSEKHCGFIINQGNASCNDVITLMEHVKETVKDKFNVELESEVILLK